MLCTLALGACGTTDWLDIEIVDDTTDGLGAQLIPALRDELAAFHRYAATDRAPVSRIVLLDRIELDADDITIAEPGSIGVDAGGRYVPHRRRVEVGVATGQPLDTARHELCHALDRELGLSRDYEDLLVADAITDDRLRRRLAWREGHEAEEVFATLCAEPMGSVGERVLTEHCGIPVREHLLEVVHDLAWARRVPPLAEAAPLSFDLVPWPVLAEGSAWEATVGLDAQGLVVRRMRMADDGAPFQIAWLDPESGDEVAAADLPPTDAGPIVQVGGGEVVVLDLARSVLHRRVGGRWVQRAIPEGWAELALAPGEALFQMAGERRLLSVDLVEDEIVDVEIPEGVRPERWRIVQRAGTIWLESAPRLWRRVDGRWESFPEPTGFEDPSFENPAHAELADGRGVIGWTVVDPDRGRLTGLVARDADGRMVPQTDICEPSEALLPRLFTDGERVVAVSNEGFGRVRLP